jgi:biotin carboxylase
MKKKLAIIGASYLQLPLVQKAKEMGIETHCFAWTEGAVCKDIADFFYPVSIVEKEKILDICKKIKIDGITTVASDTAVPTVCFVAENMNLISNSFESSLIATDKYKMRQKFLQNKVSSPKFVLADENIDFNNFTFPLIVKPTDRSGSRGVFKVEKISDLHGAVERAKAESFTGQAIIEEFVSGNEVSAETISWKGKHYILQITDKKTTGEPYFVELEHHQPSQLPAEIQEKIKRETLKVLNALNVKYGASHTEIKITESGDIYLIETGARMGGDFIGSNLVQLSTGYDFLAGIINISLGKFDEPVLNREKFSGIYFLSKETEHLKPVIENSFHYRETVQAEITDNELHSVKCSADRSGYFIYQADKKFLI